MNTLWLVATPIGNLGDLAPRATEVLSGAKLVACEDTRRTSKLLRHAGIRVDQLVVANEHTEYNLIDQVLATLDSNGDVVLVSDAGTPGISDPGQRIVSAAIAAGHLVSAVPGPTAAIMALTISGFPTERFVFEGFLPRKAVERRQRIRNLTGEPRTMLFYEAPHRIVSTIEDLTAGFGPDRPVAICREMTKIHEEVLRGTLGSVDIGRPRGEYVIVLTGAPPELMPIDDDELTAAVLERVLEGASKRDAIALIAAETGVAKNHIYDLVHRL